VTYAKLHDGPRVRRVLTALIAAPDRKALRGPPGWRIHPPSGNRAATWSISTSGNWRLTFKPVVSRERHFCFASIY
jgi:plasmid maintenance system killer protein